MTEYERKRKRGGRRGCERMIENEFRLGIVITLLHQTNMVIERTVLCRQNNTFQRGSFRS